MKAVELAVEIRQAAGKKNKALRRAGLVPANIVSHGKESVAIQTEYNHLLKVLQKVGYTQPVLIKAGDSDHTVLVTEVKFVPAKNTVEHVTFQEVKKGEKVHANVPLVLVGDAPAASKGLLVLQILDTLEVEAGALSIPEHLDVDISGLTEDGDSVHTKDIVLPEGVVLMADPEASIVKVETPRVVEETEEEAPADAETTESTTDKSESSEE
ncbi:50S ribosomal protein L25 [Candidatus Saccharibacteria bacterium]|nr:50S ribosomal protein L25 [Candidatus Saccharibacteria bacterium]MCB9821635.1 50S ribosomal protein L25 [Candidatus Nomurabacteria bacterium]